ncbi:MAG: TolC family protein [Firmicutes bacterium]|nr:TolC family protein [Bacillota bacterium]
MLRRIRSGLSRGTVVVIVATALIAWSPPAFGETGGAGQGEAPKTSQLITLEEVYNRAQASSLSMAQARLAVKQAELAYDQASRTADAVEDKNATTWDLRLVKYYSPVVALNAVEQARAGLKNSEKSLYLLVSKSYYDVLKAEGTVAAASAAVERSQGHLAVARARYDAGTVPRTEVLSAEVALASAKVDLTSARNLRELALVTLKQVAGIEDSTAFRVTEEGLSPDGGAVEPLDISKVMDPVLAARPDVRAARDRLSEAELRQRLASEFFSPNVWTVRQAALDVESAGIGLQQAEDAAVLDVRTSYQALVEAAQRYEMNSKALDQAKENLRLASLRYESGFGTFLEITTAEALLKGVEASVIQSRFDLGFAGARFDFITEGGQLK